VTDLPTIQGHQIGPLELAQVGALRAEHPEGSRYRLSRQLATLWDWRNPVGQLKDLAARTLLLKLEQRGWNTLPACRYASPPTACGINQDPRWRCRRPQCPSPVR